LFLRGREMLQRDRHFSHAPSVYGREEFK
jgi:hypothetical protein